LSNKGSRYLSGFNRRFKSIKKRYLDYGCTVITLASEGCKLLVPDGLLWAYAGGDYYEKNVTWFMDRIVKSYELPVMADIGANCGYYSTRYAGNCKKVFAFEPVSDTYKILNANIKRNGIRNVKAIKCGLSDSAGYARINLYNSSGNNSIFERNVPSDHTLKKIGEEVVRLSSLDDLVECGEIAAPDIIKIDVEGAELQVLKGAEKTISKWRPTIIMEYSENTSVDAGYSKTALLTALNLSGYHIYGIPEDETDLTLVDASGLENHAVANLIFSPKPL
jgi:FkbM family methyltransferase